MKRGLRLKKGNCESVRYLRVVADWFEIWHRQNPSNGLSKYNDVKHTTLAMRELVRYLLNTKNAIDFLLLALIQFDFLEGRFGWLVGIDNSTGVITISVCRFCRPKRRFVGDLWLKLDIPLK